MAYQNFYGRESSFEQMFRCYSVSFIEKPHLENGDKIIMPTSALHLLATLDIEYPMLFELSTPSLDRVTHCGVLEFTAEEGIVYIPSWMMEDMHIQEGELVTLKSASLPKGTYIKLQPHTSNFLDISNMRAVLEKSLRTFSCLTTGQTIMVAYNHNKYYINVVQTNPSAAISIIETDCEVDFAPPLDYKEPKRPPANNPPPTTTQAAEEAPALKVPQFTAFTGSSRRLDGKPSTVYPADQCPNEKPQQPSSTRTKRPGKLVFGSTPCAQPIDHKVAAPQVNSEEMPAQKKDENEITPKFQAFSGNKYTLGR